MKVYGDLRSGNCYKVKLLSAMLDIDMQWVDIDVLSNETQAPDFLEKNPNGKIPILELDDGRYISESNAILNYLSEGTELLPSDVFAKIKVLQWQFFEQYSHEPYIAVARSMVKFHGLSDDTQEEYESKKEGGYKALRVMENQLSKTDFLVGNRFTIADITLFAYTHIAEEGGFDLSNFDAINMWIELVKKQTKFKAMY